MHRRRSATCFIAAFAAAAFHLAAGCLVASASAGPPATDSLTCGNPGQPVCPQVTGISPSQVVGVPRTDVSVTAHGVQLSLVVDARIDPPGTKLTIASQTDDAVVVILPRSLLQVGVTYRIDFDLAISGNDATSSEMFAVLDAQAPPPRPVSLQPAPTVAPATPRPAAAAQSPSVMTVASSGSSTWSGLLIWAIGLLVGAVTCLVVAVRTGLIYEMRWMQMARDRFVLREVLLGSRSNAEQGGEADLPQPDDGPPATAGPTWTLAPAASTPHDSARSRNGRGAPGLATHPGLEPSRKRVPSFVLSPAAAPAQPSAPGPASGGNGGAGWGIREQSKPNGAPTRFRTPPH